MDRVFAVGAFPLGGATELLWAEGLGFVGFEVQGLGCKVYG